MSNIRLASCLSLFALAGCQEPIKAELLIDPTNHYPIACMDLHASAGSGSGRTVLTFGRYTHPMRVCREANGRVWVCATGAGNDDAYSVCVDRDVINDPWRTNLEKQGGI